MHCELFSSFITDDFLSRVVAGMVGGLVTASLFWLYRWWTVRHRFKKLEGVYEFINRDGTRRNKSGSAIIAYQCKRMLTVKAQGEEGKWEGNIEMAASCTRLGHGTYRYIDKPGKDVSAKPEWGVHQVHVMDDNTIESIGTWSSDPTAEPFQVILQRKMA